jgi:hypothetical protein
MGETFASCIGIYCPFRRIVLLSVSGCLSLFFPFSYLVGTKCSVASGRFSVFPAIVTPNRSQLMEIDMDTRELERLKYSGRDVEVGFGNGLYIRLRASSKTWVFRTKVSGKMRVKTLGKFPAVSILAAQKLALEQKSHVVDATGMDGIIDGYYQDSVLGSHNRKKKPHKRPEQALRYLNQLKDEFGSRPIDNVTKAKLNDYVKLYSRRGARTAEVMRVHLASIFADAFEAGKIAINPMAGISSKASGYKQVDRERVLSDEEIRSLWSWKNNDKGWQKTTENAKLIKFLLPTGLRISEAQGGYVDGNKFRVDDSKNGKSHWVYLTKLALEQLPLPNCTPTNI